MAAASKDDPMPDHLPSAPEALARVCANALFRSSEGLRECKDAVEKLQTACLAEFAILHRKIDGKKSLPPPGMKVHDFAEATTVGMRRIDDATLQGLLDARDRAQELETFRSIKGWGRRWADKIGLAVVTAIAVAAVLAYVFKH